MSIVGDIVGGLTSGASAATPTGAISAVSSAVEAIVTRIWPDPAERDKALLELRKLEQTGELQRITLDNGLLQGQIEVNKIEAASDSFWKGGWRPGAGWACVSALFMATTVPFAVQTGVWLWQCIVQGTALPPPSLDWEMILLLLGQLLGIGSLRTIEKVKRAA